VESPLESRADEVTRLRDALNELRGIMARPGLWTAGEPPQTVDTSLNVLFGIANEIEERVAQRTRDVARATEALRDSERNSRLVIDSIPGLVAILTAAGELEFVNHQILDYTGRALEELKQWATSGNIVRWYNLLVDIDERKRAEQALSSSERDLKLIIDTIPALVWSARPDGAAEFFNRHYQDFAGLSEEEARDWGLDRCGTPR